MDIQKFDRRIIERNLKNGIVDEKEYKKHLADLKNVEKETEEIILSLYSGSEDEKASTDPDSDLEPGESTQLGDNK